MKVLKKVFAKVVFKMVNTSIVLSEVNIIMTLFYVLNCRLRKILIFRKDANGTRRSL